MQPDPELGPLDVLGSFHPSWVRYCPGKEGLGTWANEHPWSRVLFVFLDELVSGVGVGVEPWGTVQGFSNVDAFWKKLLVS